MTNPQATIRMLITYVISITMAIFVGYLLTNPLDYGTLGFLGIILIAIISPVFIKWHYPLLLFSVGSPIICFFLIGRPPLWQVMTMVSLVIAIVERTLSSQRRFLSVSAMTWPLLFILGVVILTMQLTGGIGLHSVGGQTGGGKKYISLFCGIALYFALTSRAIPESRRKLYIGIFFLSGLLSFLGDLFPYLPSPLNYINMLIPPTGMLSDVNAGGGGSRILRFGAFTMAAITLINFMLAVWGMRGIFMSGRPWRVAVFGLALAVIPFGGFRAFFVETLMLILLIMFMERLYRTAMVPLLALGGVLVFMVLMLFSKQMPLNYQRTLSFLPLEWDVEAKMNADASSEWRYQMWRDLWPKVPQYLLLGKGYLLTQSDFDLMGESSQVFAAASQLDASEGGLAISGDYHNGPLSTLIPFGVWGGIGMIWLIVACLWVHYRNYCHGPPELKIINTFLLAYCVIHTITFFFIFGGFSEDVGYFVRNVGLCIALNGGVMSAKPKTAFNPRPLPGTEPQTA